MRTITEINREIKLLESDYHMKLSTLRQELDQVVKLKKSRCKHPSSKVKIRSNSYYESGRMSGPSVWREKYCSVCGEVLAHTYTEEKWSDE